VSARPDAEAQQDRRLAKALLKGKLRAWAEFYDLYAAALYRFVLARVNGDQEFAADITHDAIVLAVERIRRFDARKGRLWSWLCGIAVNKIREGRRSAARDAQLAERLEQVAPERPTPHGFDDEPVDVELVLSNLNPRHQEVLVHKYMDGLSVKEIAAQMGVSEKTVESRLTRAREAFRREHDKLAATNEVNEDV